MCVPVQLQASTRQHACMRARTPHCASEHLQGLPAVHRQAHDGGQGHQIESPGLDARAVRQQRVRVVAQPLRQQPTAQPLACSVRGHARACALVCVHVRVWACACVCARVHVRMVMYVHVRVHVCMHVYPGMRVCEGKCVFCMPSVHVCARLCGCVSAHVSMRVGV